jgi:hypothetical protein
MLHQQEPSNGSFFALMPRLAAACGRCGERNKRIAIEGSLAIKVFIELDQQLIRVEDAAGGLEKGVSLIPITLENWPFFPNYSPRRFQGI